MEAFKNKSVSDKFSRIELFKHNAALNSKIIHDTIYDFTINTDFAVFIDDGLSQTYTFPVIRDSQNYTSENLVIKIDSVSTVAILVDYGVPIDSMKNMSLSEVQQLNERFYLLDLDPALYTNPDAKMEAPHYEYVCTDNYVWGVVEYHEGDLTGGPLYEYGWIYQGASCTMVYVEGGGGTGDSGTTTTTNTDNSTYSGSNGGSGSVNTSPISGSPSSPPVDCNSDPCCILNILFTTPRPGLKNIVDNHLQTDIPNNPHGEKGAYFLKDNANRLNASIIPPTITNVIGIPDASIIANIFSAIHTHPTDTFPMFSWSDVFVLYTLHSNLDSHNQGMASFLLTCLDDNNTPQTYAIVFNNATANIIDMVLNNPFNNGMSKQQIAADFDKELKKKFKKEELNTKNYEKAFLEQMLNTNVSLYRANAGLTSWTRLDLNQSTNNVQDTPCN
ncbi:hypothetical protein DI487_14900 [Flavobacterium sediminis]|uniref:Uncharacterized protein n=3 Tax=Flavobacterium TaxID=237 RepID=A0A2U8QYT7_9FLAO|nr:hypothetical protein DI487_14900 [Flavobacterium sediminis]